VDVEYRPRPRTGSDAPSQKFTPGLPEEQTGTGGGRGSCRPIERRCPPIAHRLIGGYDACPKTHPKTPQDRTQARRSEEERAETTRARRPLSRRPRAGASSHSRNYRVGLGLARGQVLPDILRKLGMVAEGVRTTRVVHALAAREGLHMPITAALARVLEGELDVLRVIAELVEYPAGAEIDTDPVALR